MASWLAGAELELADGVDGDWTVGAAKSRAIISPFSKSMIIGGWASSSSITSPEIRQLPDSCWTAQTTWKSIGWPSSPVSLQTL
jgi:hypothetical protein